MARRPFFSGNYGSALGSTANAANLIARAGQQQGQMFANMGAQIGGMIQQYGLNKEKQKENKATIKSASGILERMKKLDPENEPQYLMQIEQLNNEDMGLGMRAKLADKTLQGLSITSQLQGQMMDQKFAAERIKASEDARKANEELAKIKNRETQRTENTYKAYERQLDDLQNRILNGAKYEDFSVQDRLILGNSAGITNRTLPLEELIYDPSKDLDFATAQQEFENIKKQGKKTDQDIKMGKLELGEKKTEIARTPDFTDRDSALASTSDLPEGVSADIKKFKNGFNVEYKYKAKEFTDIPSVPGFPNYKIVGGYVYEGDPKTKKLTKLGSENFGEKSELLQKAIESLTTKDVEQYSLAKARGEKNEDGDYDVLDPATRETVTFPYNQDLENRLIYLDGLRNKLQTQLNVDLDLTTP
tara:strand:- start:1763 stop:3019 length:1257 start_codon:yes stop_codon:yes gene_type:complete